MIVGRASNPFTPTSVGALMDPAFLRRAVGDRGQADRPDSHDARARWRERLSVAARRRVSVWRDALRAALSR